MINGSFFLLLAIWCCAMWYYFIKPQPGEYLEITATKELDDANLEARE